MTDTEYIALQKSTIVRSNRQSRFLRVARLGNATLSRVAPALAARVAESLFVTPPRHRRPPAEVEMLARACARPMRVGARWIETWTWGTGPRVLLVHGWGGRGTQLGAFVPGLVARGFSVVTFDAPGHGASDRRPVTMPEITAALQQVAAAWGPVAGLIAHSGGALVATRALYEGLDMGAAVYLAPAADLVGPALWFTETLGFPRAVRERMHRRIETRVGVPWTAFDVTALAPTLDTPLLIIHDRGDAEVPWQHGAAVGAAWPGAELLTTDGLGHRRILRAPDVVTAAVTFIAETANRGTRSLRARDVVEPSTALAH
jgi:pimeloyl-ACP methyl ester carboxylesterase